MIMITVGWHAFIITVSADRCERTIHLRHWAMRQTRTHVVRLRFFHTLRLWVYSLLRKMFCLEFFVSNKNEKNNIYGAWGSANYCWQKPTYFNFLTELFHLCMTLFDSVNYCNTRFFSVLFFTGRKLLHWGIDYVISYLSAAKRAKLLRMKKTHVIVFHSIGKRRFILLLEKPAYTTSIWKYLISIRTFFFLFLGLQPLFFSTKKKLLFIHMPFILSVKLLLPKWHSNFSLGCSVVLVVLYESRIKFFWVRLWVWEKLP